MKRPKVSVCVPVYNAAKYLRDCLDSLVAQTLNDIEIVCVDDGSTDESPRILDEYATKYNNLRIIHQENTGLGGARDAGVANAVGEYVGFVDSDDIVDLRMYEKLYNLAIKNNAEIAFCNLDLFPKGSNSKKKIWYNPYDGEVSGKFLHRNTQPWNKIFSKGLFDRTGAKFKKNDGICALLIASSVGIISTDEVLYHYRVGHASMSSIYKLESFVDTVNVNIAMREEVRKNARIEDKLGEYFEFRIINSIIQTLFVCVLDDNRRIYFKQKGILDKYDYGKNKYCAEILMSEYGRIRYSAMIYVLPKSYRLSRILMKLGKV